MKIDEKTIIIAVLAYLLIKNNKGSISGFFPSNKPTLPSNPGPLKPYGARWGNPKPSPDTTKKAGFIA